MDFLTIFTQMSWISGLLLALGLAFIVVEVFAPGFGFWGISGILLLIAGVIVRIVEGLNLVQTFTLILLIMGGLVALGILMVIGAQYGFLSHTGLFENNSTLSKQYNKTDKSLKKLVHKSGKSITDINMAGKAKIKGKIYDVVSINSFIEKGKHVKVVEIKDNTIFVRKWFE